MIIPHILAATASASDEALAVMQPALIVLVVIFAALVLSSIIFTIHCIRTPKKASSGRRLMLSVMYIATAVALLCTSDRPQC